MIEALRRLTPLQATLWLIALSSLLRLLAAGSIGLSVDEAHYALYGLHLDWSYFDHPPLVGWLQALVLPFGSSDVLLRLPAILLFALTSLVLFLLCQRLFPQESLWLGFFSVAVLHSAAILQILGLALIPETPLLLFGLLSLLALHNVIVHEGIRPWLWLGLCLGLAGLSKYTAITLVISVLIVIVLTKQWKKLLQAGPWLALMLGALVILPVLYWNAQHDWMSFAYQLNHGARNPDWQLQRFVLAQLAQLLVFGPLIIGFGVIALIAARRELSHLGVIISIAAALPILLLFALGAGRETTLPHWVALAWVALIPLAVRWIMLQWQRKWVRATTWVSAIYAVSVLCVMFAGFLFPSLLAIKQGHALADLYGWQQSSQRADAIRREMVEPNKAEPVLFVANWTQASRLAWYARPAIVQVLDARQDQFDLWFGSPQQGARGVLVLWSVRGEADLASWGNPFSRCDAAGKSPVIVDGVQTSTFSYFKCEEWHE